MPANRPLIAKVLSLAFVFLLLSDEDDAFAKADSSPDMKRKIQNVKEAASRIIALLT